MTLPLFAVWELIALLFHYLKGPFIDITLLFNINNIHEIMN